MSFLRTFVIWQHSALSSGPCADARRVGWLVTGRHRPISRAVVSTGEGTAPTWIHACTLPPRAPWARPSASVSLGPLL